MDVQNIAVRRESASYRTGSILVHCFERILPFASDNFPLLDCVLGPVAAGGCELAGARPPHYPGLPLGPLAASRHSEAIPVLYNQLRLFSTT